MIKPNLFEVYIEDIGFVKIELFNSKFEYQFKFKKENNEFIINKDNKEYIFKIGDEIQVIIAKIPGFLPKNKIKIFLKEEL